MEGTHLLHICIATASFICAEWCCFCGGSIAPQACNEPWTRCFTADLSGLAAPQNSFGHMLHKIYCFPTIEFHSCLIGSRRNCEEQRRVETDATSLFASSHGYPRVAERYFVSSVSASAEVRRRVGELYMPRPLHCTYSSGARAS